jgi:hypothetical protein
MGYDGGLNGAQKLLLIIARHLDIGQVDTKVTSGQPSFDSHRIPLLVAPLDLSNSIEAMSIGNRMRGHSRPMCREKRHQSPHRPLNALVI